MIKSIFQQTDIYLIDQILKGRFDQCKTVIDLGCGSGRNSQHFLYHKLDVFGLDVNPSAIKNIRQLAETLHPNLPQTNFRVEDLVENTFPIAFFDLVICNAVLHFAKSEAHFEAMLLASWKLLKPGGYFFCRLASSIGIENLVQPINNGRYLLPDESERFLVTQKMLLKYTNQLNANLFEVIKTTNVQNLRCMTTWCLQKKLA